MSSKKSLCVSVSGASSKSSRAPRSGVSSRRSRFSTEEEIMMAAVRKVELKYKMDALNKKHELEQEEARINMKREMLDMETELRIAEAKMEILDPTFTVDKHPTPVDLELSGDMSPKEKMTAVASWVKDTAAAVSSEFQRASQSKQARPTMVEESHMSKTEHEHEVVKSSSSPYPIPRDVRSRPQHEISSVSKVSQASSDISSEIHGDKPTIITTQAMVHHVQSPAGSHGDKQPTLHEKQHGQPSQIEVSGKGNFVSGPKLVVEEHTVQQHTQSGVYNQHSYISGPKPNVEGHMVQQNMQSGAYNQGNYMDGPKPVVGGHITQQQMPAGTHNQDSYKHSSGTGLQSLQQQPIKAISDLASALMDHQDRSSLPKRDIKPYGGDPLQFASFMNAFTHSIERKSKDDKEKLYFLEDLTTGEPNRLVKSFLNRDKGYEEAKAELRKKFGNRFVVATAFRKQADTWPIVKRDDEQAWTKFSIFLIEYQNTMVDMSHINEIDHSATIKLLLTKIPYTVRNQWRIQVDKTMEAEERCPGFKDFVEFIERQTRIVCNPVYGNIEDPSKSKDKQQQQRSQKFKTRSSYAATTKPVTEGDTTKWCSFCGNSSHNLEVCRKLSKQPHKEKLEYLKSKGLCFGCLKKAQHMCKDCKHKLKCTKCDINHPTVLHFDRKLQGSGMKNDPSKSEDSVSGKNGENSAVSCRLTGAGLTSSTQSIVPVIVRVKSTGMSIKANAMLDDGSDAVFCTESLRKRLGVKGTCTKLHVHTIAGDDVMDTKKLNGIEIMSLDGEHTIELPDVYTRKSIPADVKNFPVTEDLNKWPYLHEVNLPEIDGEVDLLIGNNVPRALEPWKVVHSEEGGPFACKTLLGWTIHGIMKDPGKSISVNRVMVANWQISQQLQEMYNADFTERLIDDVEQTSCEDDLFMKLVGNNLRHKDGHYEIPLPLKDENCAFVDNRPLAEQRLAHLQRKFLRSGEEYRNEYTAFMDDMLSNGYAERIPEQEVHCGHDRVWYIPHHSVYHPQKQKIRVVFDCAASYRGVSLNDKLLQGPDLANSLVGVIMRFRQEPVAMMADIKSMYHQVRVPPRDRDLLRFLWWPNGDTSQPIQEYRMKSHLFGAKSSPSCANYALRQTALDSQEYFDSDVVSTLQHNFYVDDCLRSVASEDQAVQLASGLREACRRGGFRLTKWISNSHTVIESIPEEDRASGVKTLDFQDAIPMERALGVLWCPETDSFRFQVQLKDKPATRRGILSIASSIYDPLGFVAPVILPAKRILQELCRIQLSWDEEIPEVYRLQWDQWLKTIPDISRFTIPRCYVPRTFGSPVEVQLHHFSDASELGYGVASYLRFTNQDGDIHCTLVLSKSRVAPLKQVSIPRLELAAATIAVKVNHQIHKELQLHIDSTHYWTDSTTVLQYIRNETKRFKTFVANRLAIIRDGSGSSQWMYVNTSQNPADECSRGLTVDKFLKNDRWLHGPPFLSKPQAEWPQEEPDSELSDEDPEVKKIQIAVHTLQVNEQKGALDRLLEYYSSWYHLRRAVAWLLKVRQKLLSKICQIRHVNQTNNETQSAKEEQPDKGDSSILSHKDLQDAEKAIIQYIQRTSFAKEIAALEGNVQVTKSSSLHRLDPQLVDGVLRVGGRLNKAAMPEESKHPYILPKGHTVTKLILHEIHENKGHAGRNSMLAQFRTKYWAPGANSDARRVVNGCVVCRRRCRKTQSQKMADLPRDRVTPDDPPFSKVGVDYFGPFNVKVGRSMVKRYGIIFTCLTTRAIHLEVGTSLDTDSCINAIRRFISRRGQVKEMRSDNGSNLVSAQKELRAEINKWNQTKIGNACLQNQVQWIFNPPTGSHFGGVWERLIRSVRKILNSVANEQTLTDEGLHTLFCEVEAIVNGRPLTTVSEDPHDIEPLTPNHLLLMKVKPTLPPAISDSKDQYARRRWKQIQFLADLFWRRWVREYLPQLQERQKWNNPVPNVVENDIVLIVDNSQPRGSWPMGKVEQTMPDSQGQVRVVKVRTKSGMFVRPVSKLITLLECDQAPATVVTSHSKATSPPVQTLQPVTKKVESSRNHDLVRTNRSGRVVKPKKVLNL